jgi:beta-lactamase class A
MQFLKKRISLAFLIVFSAGTSLLTFVGLRLTTKPAAASTRSETTPQADNCTYSISRINGYKYIQPLLAAEPKCESPRLVPLKNAIQTIIDNQKTSGSIVSASLHVEDLSDNTWTDINPDEGFHPASLTKVITLMACLKQEEQAPGFLNKVIPYKGDVIQLPDQAYSSKTIKLGNKYTIRELLEYMIAYSDNKATLLLNTTLDMNIFLKVFTDFGLKKPDLSDPNYEISNEAYSSFMKALYNASYLSMPASEYATELLGKCDFKDGIAKGIPPTVKIAHKFGESQVDQLRELHESAIVYLDKRPYLVTVMTRGSDLKKQSDVIGQISQQVYQFMNN